MTLETEATPRTEVERMALRAARTESWGRVNRQRLRAVLQYAGTFVLDVGCSSGGYVDCLASMGYRACGLDLLADAAWRQETDRGYIAGDARALPFHDGAFDTVIAFEVLEHVADPDGVLAELRRVCRKNIVLSVPDCETPDGILRAGLVYAHWRDRTHRTFFTADSLADVLERARFRLVSMGRINPILPDYPVLRSLYVPPRLAYLAARVLRRIPFRVQYCMTLLAVATRD
jgi:2-polyprenyl-3-methyl-5-hydroxy-6-metoxy-1,4-benzoquinol methylase